MVKKIYIINTCQGVINISDDYNIIYLKIPEFENKDEYYQINNDNNKILTLVACDDTLINDKNDMYITESSIKLVYSNCSWSIK